MLLKYYQKLDDAISYLAGSFCNEKKLIKSILGNKKICYIDIGTNLGSYIDFLSSFYSFKKIYSFEPIPELCEKLNKDYSNFKIKTFKIALSNTSKKKFFYQYKISSQSSLYPQNNIFKSLKKLEKKIIVQTKKFDEIFNKSQIIDYCKIDVQGEEINILKGMVKNLSKKRIKLIKIELSFISRYKNVSPNAYEILNYLKNRGYSLVSISKIKFKNNKILFMDSFFEPTK